MCSDTTPIQGAAAKTGAGNNRRNFTLGVWDFNMFCRFVPGLVWVLCICHKCTETKETKEWAWGKHQKEQKIPCELRGHKNQLTRKLRFKNRTCNISVLKCLNKARLLNILLSFPCTLPRENRNLSVLTARFVHPPVTATPTERVRRGRRKSNVT